MGFRVGDKVKVVDMLRPSESFEVGEIGKVVGIYEYCNNYPISVRMDKDKEVIDFSKEELELYKEDKMEKNFKEVIRDIKEGEVWEYRNFKIKMKDNALEILFGDCPDIRGIYFNEYHKFKLKNKEYTFEEAFAAYEEGKTIESFTGARYMKPAEESFGREIPIEEIRNKWYIIDKYEFR